MEECVQVIRNAAIPSTLLMSLLACGVAAGGIGGCRRSISTATRGHGDAAAGGVEQQVGRPREGTSEPQDDRRASETVTGSVEQSGTLATSTDRQWGGSPDDGESTPPSGSLWPSPVANRLPPLRYLPAGLTWIMTFRARDFAEADHDHLVRRAVEEDYVAANQAWQTMTGLAIDECTRLTIGLVADDAHDAIRPILVAELATAWERPSWWEGIDNRVGEWNGWSYWVPEPADGTGEGEVLVVCRPRDLAAVQESDASPPDLRRQLRHLLETASDLQLVCVAAPSFFYGEGEQLLGPSRSLLVDQLHSLWGDRIQGVRLGMEYGDRWYVELVAIPAVTESPAESAQRFRDKRDAIPTATESYLANITLIPYWQRLALRLPEMVRFVTARIRITSDRRIAMANVELPRAAAHNMILATDLAIDPPHSADVMWDGTRGSGQETEPDDPTQLLDLPFSFSLDQESLEDALTMLQLGVAAKYPHRVAPFQISIDGKALQGAGITRNQQIVTFEADQERLRHIITRLLMRANPITTVASSDELDQQIVWYVDPARGVVVTTRTAVPAGALPPEFNDPTHALTR